MSTNERLCAACGGRDLRDGSLLAKGGLIFRPTTGSWWTGYAVKGLVCMTCGAVWPYIEQERLAKMKARLAGG
ncbi:MAG TPA: hypothetical protein VFE58_13130 [Tepidisphaeraceae bacterium]|nr:hypothetical protein [Tepidisphaeraceae bacterium]